MSIAYSMVRLPTRRIRLLGIAYILDIAADETFLQGKGCTLCIFIWCISRFAPFTVRTPSLAIDPVGQSTHEGHVSSFDVLPAGQSLHPSTEICSWPRTHTLRQFGAPIPEYRPSSHWTHVSGPTCPSSGFDRPTGQSSHASLGFTLTALAYLPLPHCLHDPNTPYEPSSHDFPPRHAVRGLFACSILALLDVDWANIKVREIRTQEWAPQRVPCRSFRS